MKCGQKNFELLQELENITGHYVVERTRNFYLRNCFVKAAISFAMVSNCVQYGPLLIE